MPQIPPDIGISESLKKNPSVQASVRLAVLDNEGLTKFGGSSWHTFSHRLDIEIFTHPSHLKALRVRESCLECHWVSDREVMGDILTGGSHWKTLTAGKKMVWGRWKRTGEKQSWVCLPCMGSLGRGACGAPLPGGPLHVPVTKPGVIPHGVSPEWRQPYLNI